MSMYKARSDSVPVSASVSICGSVNDRYKSPPLNSPQTRCEITELWKLSFEKSVRFASVLKYLFCFLPLFFCAAAGSPTNTVFCVMKTPFFRIIDPGRENYSFTVVPAHTVISTDSPSVKMRSARFPTVIEPHLS